MRRAQLAAIARFGIVGVVATLTYLGLNIVVLRGLVETWPDLGNALSQAISIGVSYLGHKLFTFRSGAAHARDLPRFLAATAVAVAISSLLFRLALGSGASVVQASLAVALAYPAISFVLHNLWTFRGPRQAG